MSERLNPVCPVCGEDEPRMSLTHLTRDGGGKAIVVMKECELQCVCPRCNHGWTVEPLSKPWEDEAS